MLRRERWEGYGEGTGGTGIPGMSRCGASRAGMAEAAGHTPGCHKRQPGGMVLPLVASHRPQSREETRHIVHECLTQIRSGGLHASRQGMRQSRALSANEPGPCNHGKALLIQVATVHTACTPPARMPHRHAMAPPAACEPPTHHHQSATTHSLMSKHRPLTICPVLVAASPRWPRPEALRPSSISMR